MSSRKDIDLNELILCPKCNALHKKVQLESDGAAVCRDCDTILYRYRKRALEHSLALSLAGMMLLIVANLFPLVKIDLMGMERHVSIVSMISSLINDGFYIVGIVVSFLVLIFPFMIIVVYTILVTLLMTGAKYNLSRELLVLLSKILPWSMLEIYLVSILVALVKLMGLVEIHFGFSFWALMIFVMLDIYLSKSIHIGELWELRERSYRGDR